MPESVQFKIKKKHLDALKKLADKRGATIQQVLQHAISTESHFDKAIQEGCRVLLETPDGQLMKVVFAHERKMNSDD